MRRAAILGGLVADTTAAQDRIQFLTEGEASFHWCIDAGLANDVLKVK